MGSDERAVFVRAGKGGEWAFGLLGESPRSRCCGTTGFEITIVPGMEEGIGIPGSYHYPATRQEWAAYTV